MDPTSQNEPVSQNDKTPAVRSAVHQKAMPPRQTPWPRSVRLPQELDETVTRYLEQNRINFNQLCTFALGQFVSKPQHWRLDPIVGAQVDDYVAEQQSRGVCLVSGEGDREPKGEEVPGSLR